MIYLISLTITNIVLLASGFGMFFLGLYFNTGYHMSRLYFINSWLTIFPNTLIGLGAIIVVSSILGVLASTTRSRILLWVYTVLIACLVLPQFFTTYASFEISMLNKDMNMFTALDHKLNTHIQDAITHGGEDSNIVKEWNYIEEDLRCCGDVEMMGYTFLDDLYYTDVVPIIKPGYLTISIFIAIIEIASVALAAAYINVLKKKENDKF